MAKLILEETGKYGSHFTDSDRRLAKYGLVEMGLSANDPDCVGATWGTKRKTATITGIDGDWLLIRISWRERADFSREWITHKITGRIKLG